MARLRDAPLYGARQFAIRALTPSDPSISDTMIRIVAIALVCLLANLAPISANGQMSGSYTVGGDSPDFVAIQEAVDALMSEGVSGPVQIRLRPGTYEPANPDELVFSIPDTIAGASASSRITIEPDEAAGGAVENVIVRITDGTPSLSGAAIADVRASHVTIREITFENADAISSGVLPALLTMSVFRQETPPTGNTVEGCRFVGRTSATTTIAGIGVYGSNADILIDRNEISGAYHGVHFSSPSTRPHVSANTITGLAGIEPTNSPNNGGIVLNGGSVDARVDENLLDLGGSGGVYGINLINAENFTVTANRVVRFPAGGGLAPSDFFAGIEVFNSSAAARAAGGMIANNMVAGTYAGSRNGIRVWGDNVSVLHNSVHNPPRGIGCNSQREAGIWLQTGSGRDVRNNVVLDETNACLNSAALVIDDTTGNFFDSNNLIGPEVGAVFANGTQYLTVEAWRDATSFGENSISKQPTFAGFDDLHLAECSVVDDELRGIAEPLVIVDIDDESRDPLAPFMGADEPQGGPPPVFTGPGVYPAGTGSFQFDSGDLNGDGYADIVVTNPGSAAGGSGANDVTVLLNDGNGNLGATTHLPFGEGPSSIRIGLLNDGDTPDIVVRADDGVWNRLYSAGGFSGAIQVSTIGTSDLELADYDNDGDTDIFVVSAPPGESSSVVVFVNDGNAVFSGFSDFEVISGDTVTDIQLADVNDDGFVDVLAVEATGAGKFFVLENLGVQAPGVSRGFANPVEYAFSVTSDPARSRFVVGDFDGDLDIDAILGSAAGGDSLVFVRNTGDGVFGDRQAFDVHFSGVPEVAATLDYERDGDLDLVVASSISTVDLLLNRGDGSFERVILCNNGALAGFPIGVTTGLFDGDSSTDVAVLTFDGAVDGGIEVLYNLEWRPSGVGVDAPIQPEAERASLSPNYPNPFSTSTTIPFSLVRGGHVEVAVFDMLGRRVATATDDHRPAGEHAIRFDASILASGIYFYRITAGDFVEARQMIVVR